MRNFQLTIPTRIEFGKGVVEGIGPIAGQYGKKALLVYGRESIRKSGLYDTIVSSLSSGGVEVVDHPGVKPNPVLSHALKGIETARSAGVDMIIAAGGGSVIDESKAIAFGACHDEPLWDFFLRKREIREALPLIVVQTLPATSSEMNLASVLTNDETREKFSARSILLAPKVSFLDPGLTLTIPLQYTAYACTDILSHMMEGYFTTTSEWLPVQDGMVEGVCRAVIEAMDRLLVKVDDYEARSVIMWAGALAWSGLFNAGADGASIPNHMIEHPLSAYYDIAHGAGLSIVIPAWLKYRKGEIAERIIKFGRNILKMGPVLDTAAEDIRPDLVIRALEEWYRKIGTPVSFREAGIENPDLDAMADQSMALSAQWGVAGYTRDDVLNILRLC